MAEKEIALLRELIERLDDKKFDLEAWKNHTEIYLEQIFGKDSSVVKMIRDLKYDYSSWSLRDVSGAGKPANPVLIQAKEILEAAIASLQQFGIPERERVETKAWDLLEEELTGKQIKELRGVMQSGDPAKKEKVSKILESLDNETMAKIIAGIILP
jgi:flagellar motility protein MotE (MotC chaperone)